MATATADTQFRVLYIDTNTHQDQCSCHTSMYQPSPCLSSSPPPFDSSLDHGSYFNNGTVVIVDTSQVPWTVCLADYCDILRCDIVVERIKYNQQPKSLLSFLFPSSSSSRISEQEEENEAFEYKLTANSVEEKKVDDEHILNAFLDQQESSSSYPSTKCEEKSMKKLKSKCETIMNQCLLGLVASRMVRSFKMDNADTGNGINHVHGHQADAFDDYDDDVDGTEMDELNHKLISSICDLLSCDKSWKDFFLDVSIHTYTCHMHCIYMYVYVYSAFMCNFMSQITENDFFKIT